MARAGSGAESGDEATLDTVAPRPPPTSLGSELTKEFEAQIAVAAQRFAEQHAGQEVVQPSVKADPASDGSADQKGRSDGQTLESLPGDEDDKKAPDALAALLKDVDGVKQELPDANLSKARADVAAKAEPDDGEQQGAASHVQPEAAASSLHSAAAHPVSAAELARVAAPLGGAAHVDVAAAASTLPPASGGKSPSAADGHNAAQQPTSDAANAGAPPPDTIEAAPAGAHLAGDEAQEELLRARGAAPGADSSGDEAPLAAILSPSSGATQGAVAPDPVAAGSADPTAAAMDLDDDVGTIAAAGAAAEQAGAAAAQHASPPPAQQQLAAEAADAGAAPAAAAVHASTTGAAAAADAPAAADADAATRAAPEAQAAAQASGAAAATVPAAADSQPEPAQTTTAAATPASAPPAAAVAAAASPPVAEASGPTPVRRSAKGHAGFRGNMEGAADIDAAHTLLRPGDEARGSRFRRAVFWHWANLEYGCSADLDWVRHMFGVFCMQDHELCLQLSFRTCYRLIQRSSLAASQLLACVLVARPVYRVHCRLSLQA